MMQVAIGGMAPQWGLL